MLLDSLKESEKINLTYDEIIETDVDYSALISDIVSKAGVGFRLLYRSYEYQPSLQKKKVKFVVIHHKKIVYTDEVIKNMEQYGIRPATVIEILHFYIQHKEKYKCRDLAALGEKIYFTGTSNIKGTYFIRWNTGIVENDIRFPWPHFVNFLGVVE